jgi:GNAT superfamily N-acetyltransferase
MQIIVQQAPFEKPVIDQVFDCSKAIFKIPTKRTEMDWRLMHMPDVVVHTALWDGELAGFKIAYATRRRRLYSWLGGVLPGFRRRGVARTLMEAQHSWAKEKGYLNVETGTVRNNVAMIALNLSSGYEIIGTYARAGTTRVLMAKRL